MDLSKLSPLLTAHGIRLIGIGLEEFGAQEFIDGKFFSGELYLDSKQEQYKALGYKKYNVCSILCALCGKDVKEVHRKAKSNKVPSNLRGNGFQSGGTLIISKGGKELILSYKMQALGDHLGNAEILKALGLSESSPSAIVKQPTSTASTANDDAKFTSDSDTD